MSRPIKHFLDLMFTVVAEIKEYSVEYTVYDIDMLGENPTTKEFDIPLWHRKGSSCTPDGVEKIEEAEVFMNGYVKWDACSNWSLDAMQRQVMYHACDREGLARVGEVMARCYDWTAELLPTWDDFDDVPAHLKLTEDANGKYVKLGEQSVPENYLSPEFDKQAGATYAKEDWRLYIHEAVARIWSTFTPAQKATLATAAHRTAWLAALLKA